MIKYTIHHIIIYNFHEGIYIFPCTHSVHTHTNKTYKSVSKSQRWWNVFNKYTMVIYSSYELFCITSMSYVIILGGKESCSFHK